MGLHFTRKASLPKSSSGRTLHSNNETSPTLLGGYQLARLVANSLKLLGCQVVQVLLHPHTVVITQFGCVPGQEIPVKNRKGTSIFP